MELDFYLMAMSSGNGDATTESRRGGFMREGRDRTPSSPNPWGMAGLLLGAMAAGVFVSSVTRRRYSFRGKSVLITGGSRGLGLEIARLLAEEGAYLVIVGRNATTLESARVELEKLGGCVHAIPCDVRNREEIQSAVDEAVRQFGRLDVLINNAGIIQAGPFEKMTLKDYENAMATHAWGPLYAMLKAVPQMRKQGGGRIVNISSIGGKLGVPHFLPYVMSKFALAGLSEGLGAEAARLGIHVTTVYPGLMRTGSHVNASFKGNNRREFAWFSIAAGFPLLSINASRAALQIVEACRAGREQIVITPTARAATVARAVTPTLVERSLRWMDAVLPAAGDTPDDAVHTGWESRSWISPSKLTRLADQAIERNNEHRAAS
jgi:NAD(P)-dependent dehydrogenase (short-subunit alcohol dehydrogenase family)